MTDQLDLHLHLHLSHIADALIQSDLQIGAYTLRHPVEQPLYNSATKICCIYYIMTDQLDLLSLLYETS